MSNHTCYNEYKGMMGDKRQPRPSPYQSLNAATDTAAERNPV